VFHYALRPGGFLFLGGAEGVTRHGDLFAPVDKKARIFQRRDHASPPLPFPLFVPGRPLPPAGANGVHREPVAAGPTLRRAVEAEVLELHAPAHVVVNRDGDTVYHSPRVGKYLQPAVGQPSRQVLAMARKGLRLDLRLALEEAVETRRAAVRERVAVELDDGRVQPVSLTVAPLAGHDRGGPLFLVLFADLGPPLARGEEAARGHPAADGSAVRRLELELRDTRERLQATIEQNETAMEELKSANEELVSLNEELQSTNEELETSKEEIQSVNEELQTVNHELGAKVEQLNQANGDLRNLFESTGIGILFLDRHLAVRSFTPAVTGLFSLIPADRGRPLADIAGRLDRAGLRDDLAAVLAGGGPVERRVGGGDGRAHYLMRVLPYRDDGAVDGAVVTFVDITGMVEAERRQQVLVHELDHRVRNMLTVVAAIARQTAARSSSVAGFEEALLGRVEALGRAYGLVTRERGGDVALGEVVREELEPHVADGGDRVATRGPGVMLRSRAAVALGLVLHELATNAVKHGALSSAEGRVAVEWRVEELADGRRLILCWEEAGGPPVRGPGTRGFGSELIEHQVGHDLGGEVATDFRPRGLAVRLVVPWTADLFG
jgi:two-component system CheB/CheR fusion protein